MLSWLKCSRTFVRSAFNPHDALPAGLIRGFETAYLKRWFCRKAYFFGALRLDPRGLRALNLVFLKSRPCQRLDLWCASIMIFAALS